MVFKHEKPPSIHDTRKNWTTSQHQAHRQQQLHTEWRIKLSVGGELLQITSAPVTRSKQPTIPFQQTMATPKLTILLQTTCIIFFVHGAVAKLPCSQLRHPDQNPTHRMHRHQLNWIARIYHMPLRKWEKTDRFRTNRFQNVLISRAAQPASCISKKYPIFELLPMNSTGVATQALPCRQLLQLTMPLHFAYRRLSTDTTATVIPMEWIVSYEALFSVLTSSEKNMSRRTAMTTIWQKLCPMKRILQPHSAVNVDQSNVVSHPADRSEKLLVILRS